jgi:hypothetical protein
VGRAPRTSCDRIRRSAPPPPEFNGLVPDESGRVQRGALYERVGSFDPGRIRARLESLIDAETDTASLLSMVRPWRLRKRLETATWDLAERSS